jgi:hypothetical protein
MFQNVRRRRCWERVLHAGMVTRSKARFYADRESALARQLSLGSAYARKQRDMFQNMLTTTWEHAAYARLSS